MVVTLEVSAAVAVGLRLGLVRPTNSQWLAVLLYGALCPPPSLPAVARAVSTPPSVNPCLAIQPLKTQLPPKQTKFLKSHKTHSKQVNKKQKHIHK